MFGYVVMLWRIGIAANLISMGRYYDIAVRDLLLSCGAYALARLTEARRLSGVVTEPGVRDDEFRRAA
jgi:hypothetical protein